MTYHRYDMANHQAELPRSRSPRQPRVWVALWWGLIVGLGLPLDMGSGWGQPAGPAACQDASACVDIVFVLDRSVSMNEFNKFEEMKAGLVSVLQGDLLIPERHRVGLVVFPAGRAPSPSGVLVPLTDDYFAVESAIQAMEIVPGDSDVGATVAVSKELLLVVPSPPTVAKAIMLLTDGAPSGVVDPCGEALAAAQAAKDEGIRVFTIYYGVGSIADICPDDSAEAADFLAAMATESLNDQATCEEENVDGDHFFCQIPGEEVMSIYRHALLDLLSPPPPFVTCAEGLALCDSRSGLMWEMKVEGGTGASCLEALHGVDATCLWEEAAGSWVEALNAEDGVGYAGFADWRLPSIQELVNIVDYGRSEPAIDPIFGPTASMFYWSSTSRVDVPDQVWGADFLAGMVLSAQQENAHHVRAVRDG